MDVSILILLDYLFLSACPDRDDLVGPDTCLNPYFIGLPILIILEFV